MAVSFNSYYLYKKYEKRANQPWLPVYPETLSIDGDGSMPKVLKLPDDPACHVGPKEKIILFEGSQSFAQWQPARFSKSEGFLDVYFEHNYNGYLQYLYENNEPLYVEFSSVPDSGTLCLQTGSWSPIFDPALPVSASEPLQIYITDSSMYNEVNISDLALIDKASNGFTITSVYFYK